MDNRGLPQKTTMLNAIMWSVVLIMAITFGSFVEIGLVVIAWFIIRHYEKKRDKV